MKTRTCGNCVYFTRVKDWGSGRNGLCDKFDYNCHTDSTYAKKCKGYKALKYKRKRPIIECTLG